MAYLDAAEGARRDGSADAFSRTLLTGAAKRKPIHVVSASIATTNNTDNYVIVPETGTLDSVDFSSLAALAAHDSNYITWTITNLGQGGAGSTALSANTKRSLTLHGTAANLAVVAGDRLLIRAAATGTLAGAVTVPVYLLRFTGTT